jgi:hypothetical protein
MNLRRIAPAAVLGLLIAAAPAGAATVTPGTQTADATVPTQISATFPSAPFSLAIAPGAPAVSGNQAVTVKANSTWGLRVFADHSPMAAWDGTEYGTDTLDNALQVAVDGTDKGAVPQAAATTNIAGADADAAIAAGDTGITKQLTFSQSFSYGDKPGEYRTVITYAADTEFVS